jgi:pimeloyl-ACP methyl ester carboxylesterase
VLGWPVAQTALLEFIETMQRIAIGNQEIAYRHAGEGPSLVLLHGGLEDGRAWRGQIEGLSDEFAVFAWDAPGCGQSSEPSENWRMPEYADCLAAWLRALGLTRPHILGLSWGSTLALELYRRHPDVPASLVLVGAYAGWAGSLPPSEVARRLEGLLATADLPPEHMVADILPTLLPSTAPKSLVEEVERLLYDNAGVVHPVGYRAMLRAMGEADLRDVLGKIRVPTLLLYGENDQRSSLAIAREFQSRVPGSELVLIPGAGHICHMEAPAEFNTNVRRFLRSVRAHERSGQA